jgi:peptidoglycan/LPS O-acetylase OafA/YrhL
VWGFAHSVAQAAAPSPLPTRPNRGRTARSAQAEPLNASVERPDAASTEPFIPKGPRRLDIQGLRALAVSLVVAFHAGLPVPGGFVGVDVFFVVSGFVIAQLLLAELSASGRIDFGRFYARRVRRLLPALALMIVVVTAVGVLAIPAASQQTAGMTGGAAALFVANFQLASLDTGYFAVGASLNPFLHTWTLGVEEQFYVLFPLALLGAWCVTGNHRFKRAVLAVMLFATCVASFVFTLSLVSGHWFADANVRDQLAFYASPSRAWEFGAGALVVLACPLAGGLSVGAVRLLSLAGLAALALAASRSEANDLLPVGATCVLLAAGVGGSRGVPQLLTNRVALWVGDRSYSIYLWHWPLIVFAAALWPGKSWILAIAAAVSFVPAWLSYRYVENPLRRNDTIRGRRAVGLALACLVLPLAASAGLVFASRALQDTSAMKQWKRSQLLHADVLRGCDGELPTDHVFGHPCAWTVPQAVGSVVLLGDSNAGHFTEPLVRAANGRDLNATVITYSSCPTVGLRVERARAQTPGCSAFTAGAISWLSSEKPDLVVLAARTDWYLENTTVGLGLPSSKTLTHDTDAKAKLWGAALRSTISQLREAGIPVLVVHPVPSLPRPPEGCAALLVLLRGCGTSVSRAKSDARLRRAIEVERAVVRSSPEASTLDFATSLCPRGTCQSISGGTFLYRDPQHLSVAGALTLTGQFSRAIGSMVPRA